MSSRRDVLKPFIDKQGFMDDRINSMIEINRKGWGYLEFVDGENNPVTPLKLEITQKNHTFKYGANLFMLDEFPSEEQNMAYRRNFAKICNLATLPFYWSDIEPEPGALRFSKDSPKVYRRPAPDLCLEYCADHNIMPKAHCLNYANFHPQWARGDVATEKRLLDKRFREIAERYADKIRDWEVTNETFWGTNRPGFPKIYDQDDLIEWSFNLADRYFPNNRLLINEAHCRIWDDSYFFKKRSPYYMQIERALNSGAKIDSIGMQYHMFFKREEEASKTRWYYDPERIYDVLDTYSQFGIPIQITELTIPGYAYTAEDEELQAEIIKNVYSLWFSHKSMEAIVYWNLIDGFAAFAPIGDMTSGENYYHGGLIRHDFTLKPAYHVIDELFNKTWRTNLIMNSLDSNRTSFKGFYGDYELTITTDNQIYKRELLLDKDCDNQHKIVI